MEHPRPTTAKLSFADRLRDEWLARRAKNPAFSQRAFARSLDLDPSDLNKMMNGTRSPGRRVASQIGNKLGWPGVETDVCFRYRPVATESPARRLPEEWYEALSHWKYFAILSLFETAGFDARIETIAQRLGLPYAEADVAVHRLKRLGLLSQDPAGRWRDSTTGNTTSYGNPGETTQARRQLQRSYVEKSMKAIAEVPMQRRDHSTLTMTIDPKRIEAAREMITVFRRDLKRFLEQGDRSEVYALNIGLFPLTEESKA